MQLKLCLLGLCVLLASHTSRAESGDERAIRELAAQWETAWNHHDPAALARLVTSDADFVNVRGTWAKGREQFEKNQTAQQEGNERNSTWKTTEVNVRFVNPDVAIVHTYWTLSGELSNDGAARPPHLGIITWTVLKRDGQWLIAASQATDVVPAQSH